VITQTKPNSLPQGGLFLVTWLWRKSAVGCHLTYDRKPNSHIGYTVSDITVSVNFDTHRVQSWRKQSQCPDMTHIQRTVTGSPVTGRPHRGPYWLQVTGSQSDVTDVTLNLLAFWIPIRTVLRNTNTHRPQEV